MMLINDIIRNSFKQPPFEPTGEAEAIISIGVLFFLLLMVILFLILMLLSYKWLKDILPSIVVWGFSIDISFGLIGSPDFPFNFVAVFFMVWQTTILLMCSLDFSRILKEKKRKKQNV